MKKKLNYTVPETEVTVVNLEGRILITSQLSGVSVENANYRAGTNDEGEDW